VSFVAADVNNDCVVNEIDLSLLLNQWMRTDCSGANNDCSGADFQPDGNVDMFDFSLLADVWMNDSVPLVGCN